MCLTYSRVGDGARVSKSPQLPRVATRSLGSAGWPTGCDDGSMRQERATEPGAAKGTAYDPLPRPASPSRSTDNSETAAGTPAASENLSGVARTFGQCDEPLE